MIGALIFADIPLAAWPGSEPNWGWIDRCPEKNIWNKVPANEGGWSAQAAARNIWNKKMTETSAWRKLEATQSAWSKQEARVEDHKKC